MRYLQMLLCLTILLLQSAMLIGGERPSSAPPIDERLTGLEQRLGGLEERVNALEGKTARKCPCPEGPCICDPENCRCPNCPIHKTLSTDRHILMVTASWCGPCQEWYAKELEDLNKPDKPLTQDVLSAEWVHSAKLRFLDVDTNLKRCAELGVKQYPTFLLMEGDKVLGKKAGYQSARVLANWYRTGKNWDQNPGPVSSRTAQPTVSKPSVRYYHQPAYSRPTIRYSQPNSYFRPSYGSFCPSCVR